MNTPISNGQNVDQPMQQMQRVHRRLRIQHSRWLLQQPVNDTFWFRVGRNARRFGRRFEILVLNNPAISFVGTAGLWLLAGAIGLALLGAIAFGIVAMPSIVLRLPNNTQPFANPLENTTVALTRLSIFVSVGILFLWCILPGTSRKTLFAQTTGHGNRNTRLLRRPRSRRSGIPVRVLEPLVLALGTIVLFGLCGVFVMLGSIIAIPLSIVFALSLTWLVYHIGIRIMRRRSRIFWKLSLPDCAATVLLFIAFGLVEFVGSNEIIGVSRNLTWIGPVGCATSNILSVTQGNYLSLIPLAVIVFCNWILGWWIGRGAASWKNRRKLVETRLRLSPPSQITQAETPKRDRAEIEKQIDRELDQAIVSRQLRAPAYLLNPIWMRRRRKWLLILAVFVIALIGPVAAMQAVTSQYDSVPTVGGNANAVDPLTAAMCLVLVVVLGALELVALVDRGLAGPVLFEQRPLSPWQHFWNEHRNGMCRLPAQMLICAPIALMLTFTESFSVVAPHLPLAAVDLFALLLVFRTLVVSVTVLFSVVAVCNHRLFIFLVYSHIASFFGVFVGFTGTFPDVQDSNAITYSQHAVVAIGVAISLGLFLISTHIRKRTDGSDAGNRTEMRLNAL